ncbi:hypothetical protein HEL27_005855 [Escherichia coli]|nr:hypothetical protein [Escherichia coli]
MRQALNGAALTSDRGVVYGQSGNMLRIKLINPAPSDGGCEACQVLNKKVSAQRLMAGVLNKKVRAQLLFTHQHIISSDQERSPPFRRVKKFNEIASILRLINRSVAR